MLRLHLESMSGSVRLGPLELANAGSAIESSRMVGILSLRPRNPAQLLVSTAPAYSSLFNTSFICIFLST